MTKQQAVEQARRVNRTIVDHLRSGRIHEASYCKWFRNGWMAEARRV